MKKPYFWGKPGAQDVFVEGIKTGHVVLADSDTVLGLFAGITAVGAHALDTIKTRRDKPYLILIGSKADWMHYALMPEGNAALKLIDECWPGPLTLILPMRFDMPSYMGSIEKTVAIRMPDHKELCEVAAECGGIFSTSANISGQPIPATLDQIDERIQEAVACVVLSDASKTCSLKPSTILDCTGAGIRVVREGAYQIAELERVCGEIFY